MIGGLFVRMSWDELKRRMARMYCKAIGRGDDPDCVEIQSSRRKLIVIMPKDGLPNQTCTIYVELHGTPPKAYAVLHPLYCFDPDKSETITIVSIDIFNMGFSKHVVLYDNKGRFYEMDLRELRSRSDVALYVLPNIDEVRNKADDK